MGLYIVQCVEGHYFLSIHSSAQSLGSRQLFCRAKYINYVRGMHHCKICSSGKREIENDSQQGVLGKEVRTVQYVRRWKEKDSFKNDFFFEDLFLPHTRNC